MSVRTLVESAATTKTSGAVAGYSIMQPILAFLEITSPIFSAIAGILGIVLTIVLIRLNVQRARYEREDRKKKKSN